MELIAELGLMHHHHHHHLHYRHQHLFRCASSPFFYTPFVFPPKRFLSLDICHTIPLHGVYRIIYCMKNHKSVRRLTALPASKGKQTKNVDELCKIIWTVEADLEDGHLLYITGDPAVLGCWKPKKAVLMSPTEHANIWKAEFEIASGLNFKYNYFIKGKSKSSSNVIWKPGPAFSLSLPLTVLGENKVMVRDVWIRTSSHVSSAHTWFPWIEETYFPEHPSSHLPVKDDGEIASLFKNDVLKSDIFSLEDQLYYDDDNMDMESMDDEDSHSTNILSENYQPLEEPWLLLSPPFSVSKDRKESNEVETDNTVEEPVKLVDTEKLLPEDSTNVTSKDPVSTVILINSSICTMQRIAVLENDKLVELLLEPVKSNVQCDSVYVGVVSKLVPHMGGAFVNIGSSRPALMDIKQNREPFIFPPFRQKTKKQKLDIKDKNDHESHDADVSDGISDIYSEDGCLKSVHNAYDEHEGEDDFYITEVLKENVNGSLIDDEVEADFEDDIEGSEIHIDETSNSLLGFGMNGSVNSHILQTKDTEKAAHVASEENKWIKVRKGTKIIVQVVKEGLGTKGPTLTAYPKLRSRFWVLIARCDKIGVSKKISGVERTRLKVIAKTLQPKGFGLTVRTVAAGHSLEELHKDLEGLLSTWKNIVEHAKSAALAADEGVEGAVPVILHRAMGQTLSVVQDYFNENVNRMVVDSPRTFHEVTNYLQEMAPDLCDRVELYDKKVPLFDEFNIEGEIDNILKKRVPLANGGSLIIEQTEALVSIDVNGGHGMFGHGTSQQKAILDVNLAAAKRIARELRLRDIGGIIVVDFIDMTDEANKRLVYEEVKKAVERDKSMVKVSELSRHGLMEITRKRVRPSVTFMISEPCACCHATGRVEALETSFSKIEQQICRFIATMDIKADSISPKSWPKFILRVDHHMCEYLTSGKKTRLATLSSSLKVWILLKVARGFTRGAFEVKPFVDDKGEKNQHQAPISMLRSSEASTKKPGQKLTIVPVKKSKARGK
ncbi:ribonuclease E/G-like protein, chloroplastic isoform X1 [Arachis stenosperma]|uniref:ribonuclease E/G-like protein, chloroplastic isoform X1 n=2 Tax=Arachis stenosperma TaxID=217475 RepID=UPI0025ABF1BE|nr:ribonuclease E/G-like protein, chloroplastic isoform X1 [Arachis stenosperma]